MMKTSVMSRGKKFKKNFTNGGNLLLDISSKKRHNEVRPYEEIKTVLQKPDEKQNKN